MAATRTQDEVHPLLAIDIHIDLTPALTRPMPHVGPMNTAAGFEELYNSAPWHGRLTRKAGAR